MKSFLFLSVLLISVLACTKDKDEPSDIFPGTYIGKSSDHSSALKEVFTSMTQSHWEWVSDSFSIDPDTLLLIAFSKDSFELQGSVAKVLPDHFKRFAFADGEHSGTVYNFQRSFGLSGYFNQNLQISLDTDKKSISWHYLSEYSTPASNFERQFNGTR